MFGITMRRKLVGGLAAGALAGLTAGTIALPVASAAPPCDAAGLNTAVSAVASDTAAYLSGHPGANDAITNAGASGDAEGAIRTYFIAHPTEWADLQRIAQPLRSLRAQCEVDVAPTEIARLYDAMAS
jgi:hemophore-related protein